MDNLIPKLYREYGIYVNESRSFPLDLDGYKPVERRVLLAAHQIAKDKFVKSARVDAHCLTGDTKIKLTDGVQKTIEEIYNEGMLDFFLFGYDINLKKPVITKAERVNISKYVNKIIIITTDSGKIKCTEDHLWLTKEGIYKKALDLKIDDSLEEAIDEAKKYKNHNIINIEIVELENHIPVYDIINSKHFNNFIVMLEDNTGIISHNCLGHWHPHSSSYGTIVQLVQNGFLDGQGNFGNNIGVESSPAAAMRYTECKLSKNTNNLAFRLIDYVPWSESELDDEPEYLPTMYAGCLLGKEYTVGIGFGYKTLIPCYTIEDLKKRLYFLLGKTKEKPIIRPISDCKFLSSDKDFELLLTKGKATISVQGIFKVDNIRCKAIIKTWPPGKRFETILSKFEKELENQDIGYIDESSKDNGGTHIVFEVLKTRNRNEIFKVLVKKLGEVLVGTIPFEIIVVNHPDGIPKLTSVDEMLLKTYDMYKSTNDIMLKSEEIRYKALINENKLIQKIRSPLSKQLQSKESDINKIIDAISTDTFIERNVVKDLIQKHKISKLLSVKDDLKDLNDKIVSIKNCLDNLDTFVLKQYN